MKITSVTEITRVMKENPRPLAVHEIKEHIYGYSENNLATRLSEMQRAGKVIGKKRAGVHYNEWRWIGD
jgi:DNA-binding transcriptional regulator GbsR (MarR family)